MFQKVLFIGLILISNQLCAENYDFKPGLWETTTTSEVVEIDAPPEIQKMMQHMAQMPVRTETECIASINSVFNTEPEPDDAEECKTTISRVNSNKMTFEMLCTGEDGTSKGTGEMNLRGESFTSSLVMTSINGPMTMNMKIVGNGKYIGACR